MRVHDTSSFVLKAQKKHGSKFDYSKSVYAGYNKPIVVICPMHGEFTTTPASHYLADCPRCAGVKSYTTAEFIAAAELVHKSRYDYSKVEYEGTHTKVCIICPEHGEFWQTPAHHLKGSGCPSCNGGAKIDGQVFIARSSKIHSGKYDYSKVEYKNSKTKVCIICPEHGEFWQTPYRHLHSLGCRLCANSKISDSKLNTTTKFIQQASSVHCGKYDYSKVEYVGAKNKVTIVCKKHGTFQQTANDHLNGNGCPTCANGLMVSSTEAELQNFVKLLCKDAVFNDRTLLSPKELDVVIPSKKIAVELNGFYWHSAKPKNYHLEKTISCEKLGYSLIHILDQDWVMQKEKVKAFLRFRLGAVPRKVAARSTIVREIETAVAHKFLEENHLQGACSSSVRFGLFYKEELVAIMTFGKPRFNKHYTWELLRFCSLKEVQVIGGASKLFKAFTKQFKGSVLSYARRDYSSGKLYTSIGFTFLHYTKPNYVWCKKGKVLSRYATQKHKLKALRDFCFDETQSEFENMTNNGYYQVFDTGNLVFAYNNIL